jgi:quercetin 2,3-dioxygenase
MSISPIKRVSKGQNVLEGAGVPIYRAFGHDLTDETDPFLMLDHFRSEDGNGMAAGFPWHPHRGIETISYILAGAIEHEDSLGNKGNLTAGDIQWMTAGSGTIHQEMPNKGTDGAVHGFQLWANLPASEKMSDPRYQDIQAKEIPEIIDDDGTKARVIAGEFWGQTGPVIGIATNPRYLDIEVPPNTTRSLGMNLEQHAFAYVFEGSGTFRSASTPVPAPTEYVTEQGTTDVLAAHPVENRNLILFDSGDEIRVSTGDHVIRFLLVSGKPLREPVAWHGPIVMNTYEELQTAFTEYQEGTFLKHAIPSGAK